MLAPALDNPANPLFHTINDVCRILGIGRTTYFELVKTGEITPCKLGTRTLIPADELAEFANKIKASRSRTADPLPAATPARGVHEYRREDHVGVSDPTAETAVRNIVRGDG